MQPVAHHLQIHAHNNSMDAADRDLYARSAYNRYYYACFLMLRATFSDINPDWSCMNHKGYPEVLRGTIKKRLSRERKKAYKNCDNELYRVLELAIHATEELAKIMESANASRIVADYKPDIKVQFNDSERFSLNAVDVSRLHSWCEHIPRLLGNLKAAWRQLDA